MCSLIQTYLNVMDVVALCGSLELLNAKNVFHPSRTDVYILLAK